MIIYNLRTPVDSDKSICVGVTGENKTFIQEFFIEGLCDSSYDFAIHLRFPDGQVNSVIPDEIIVDSKGTKIVWIVKKTDIFVHGFFDVQLEATNDEGKVFQTSIVTLYADESLAVEDKEYENPNAETLRLREEAHEMLCDLKLQQSQFDENMKNLLKTDITKKADKTEVEGKEDVANKVSSPDMVTDKNSDYPSVNYLEQMYYNFEETDDMLFKKADKSELLKALEGKEDSVLKVCNSSDIEDEDINYPSITYLKEMYYDYNEIDNKLTNKADKSTTLAGYGITDGVTSAKLSSELAKKQDTLVYDEKPTGGHITQVMSSHAIMLALDKKPDTETGSGNLTLMETSSLTSDMVTGSFKYQKFGKYVSIDVYITFRAFSQSSASSTITFTGLPYVCKSTATQRNLCVTTAKKQMIYAIGANTNRITLLNFIQPEYSDGEVLALNIVYRIA